MKLISITALVVCIFTSQAMAGVVAAAKAEALASRQDTTFNILVFTKLSGGSFSPDCQY